MSKWFLHLPVHFVLLCCHALCCLDAVPCRARACARGRARARACARARARAFACLVHHCDFSSVLCITVTFRLSVRVSFLVCCGRYVCFSKPWTFHNGLIFFASRVCFENVSRLQALPVSHIN